MPGSSVNPCEADIVIQTSLLEGMGESVYHPNTPTTIRQYLNGSSISYIPHIVLRGTYIPDTERCMSGTPARDPSYLDRGYPQRSLLFLCYADVRVNGYILGSGPPRLTVVVNFLFYEHGSFAQKPLNRFPTEEENVEWSRSVLESVLRGEWEYGDASGIGGREVVLFIGPPHSHSIEAWEVFDTWDVQRREDETVVVVHPRRDYWRWVRPADYETHRSALEMELPAFTQAVATASQARVADYGGRIALADIQSRAEGVDLPMLVTDANRLRQFFTDVGAYSHPDGPPAQPPLPCGLVVPGQDHNADLMLECLALLAGKDALRGTATLNWSVDTAITSWDGITTSGTPSRVTELDLSGESLTGSIPAELGSLPELTKLDLSSNSLTGEIPREIGRLSNLTEIRLSGNSLTGCIPSALKDVTTNDLSSLNLLYCPPAPGGLTASTPGENSVVLSWSAVANTSKYRVEYRGFGSADWTVGEETLTGTTHTVDELHCTRDYRFRVSAYGNGTTYPATWSDPSPVVSETTGTCTPAVFGASSYAFSVAGDAAVGASVGTVSATHPDGDTVSYSIVEGNRYGAFTIDESTGAITVKSALDYAAISSHELWVVARVEKRGVAVVEVTVSVLPT